MYPTSMKNIGRANKPDFKCPKVYMHYFPSDHVEHIFRRLKDIFLEISFKLLVTIYTNAMFKMYPPYS